MVLFYLSFQTLLFQNEKKKIFPLTNPSWTTPARTCRNKEGVRARDSWGGHAQLWTNGITRHHFRHLEKRMYLKPLSNTTVWKVECHNILPGQAWCVTPVPSREEPSLVVGRCRVSDYRSHDYSPFLGTCGNTRQGCLGLCTGGCVPRGWIAHL